MGAAKEKGSCYSKYDYKQHELERHASDRSIKLVGTMIGGETWTELDGRPARTCTLSIKELGPACLGGPACLVREGRTGKVTIASSTGKHEVASVKVTR